MEWNRNINTYVLPMALRNYFYAFRQTSCDMVERYTCSIVCSTFIHKILNHKILVHTRTHIHIYVCSNSIQYRSVFYVCACVYVMLTVKVRPIWFVSTTRSMCSIRLLQHQIFCCTDARGIT